MPRGSRMHRHKQGHRDKITWRWLLVKLSSPWERGFGNYVWFVVEEVEAERLRCETAARRAE